MTCKIDRARAAFSATVLGAGLLAIAVAAPVQAAGGYSTTHQPYGQTTYGSAAPAYQGYQPPAADAAMPYGGRAYGVQPRTYGAQPPPYGGQPVKFFGSVAYACTGIAETRNDPRWRRFPLKVEFANAYGRYLADVSVWITDRSGALRLQADCFAPWLVADLPPGRYNVTVVARNNYKKDLSVTVGAARQKTVVVRFPEIREL